MQNSVIKYMTRMGQNTGMLNISKNVQKIPMTVLFEMAYQNLNSGNRRMNGRNSWFDRVGSSGPWSSPVRRKKQVFYYLSLSANCVEFLIGRNTFLETFWFWTELSTLYFILWKSIQTIVMWWNIWNECQKRRSFFSRWTKLDIISTNYIHYKLQKP